MQEILFVGFGWLVSAFALWLGYYEHKRAAHLSVFISFTERYRSIMSKLPGEMRGHAFESTNISAFLQPGEEQAALIDYLNMCAEELALHREELINPRIWRIWEREMRSSLSSRLVVEGWQVLRPSFVDDEEFCRFVDEIHLQINRKSA